MNKPMLFALASVGLSLVGCSGTAASYKALEPHASLPREAKAVDVLLDEKPSRPFRVVGELSAIAIESPQSVAMMQREAAKKGLDGIYWIDCATAASGHCTAKGFVYTTTVASHPVGATASR